MYDGGGYILNLAIKSVSKIDMMRQKQRVIIHACYQLIFKTHRLRITRKIMNTGFNYPILASHKIKKFKIFISTSLKRNFLLQTICLQINIETIFHYHHQMLLII